MHNQLQKTKEGCLICLAYFHIFHHPLTADELLEYNPVKTDLSIVKEAINELKEANKVYHSEPYYLLNEEPNWILERELGHQKALGLLEKSKKYVRIISSFPFVEAIAISGSLSKYYAKNSSDIDYFIICTKNRLWIARTLLHLYKKFSFMYKSQHYLCMNYFIDKNNLELKDHNLYTATELLTMIPAYNRDLIQEMIDQNKWLPDYLPNKAPNKDERYLIARPRYVWKSYMEKVFDVFFPKSLNYKLMKLTDAKWRRKWRRKKYPQEDYETAFETSIHISKNHPAHYQKKVLNALQDLNKQPL